MNPLVKLFAEDYFVYNSISPKRRWYVLLYLSQLEAFTGEPVEQATPEQIRAWMASKLADGLMATTVRNALFGVRPFYRWAWERGHISAEQWLRVQSIPSPRGGRGPWLPRPYSRDEIAHFWTELDERWPASPPHMLKRFRDGRSKHKAVWRHGYKLQAEAIISLALYGGLRRREIYNSSLDDIHPDNDFIVVRFSKRTGDQVVPAVREVPYTQEGREAIANWLVFRGWMLERMPLRPGIERGPWLVTTAYANMNKAFGASMVTDTMGVDTFDELPSRIGRGWEYHRFRHTAGTEWYRAGVPIEKVSRMLGHSNVGQTMGYTQIVKDDLQTSMRRNEARFASAVARPRKAA